MSVKELVSKKVGPLPLGVWAGIVAGGMAYGVHRRKRTANNTVKVPVAMDTGGNAGYLASAVQPLSNNGTTYLGNGAAGTSGFQPPTIATNSAWQTSAQNSLIAKGYEPTAVSNALGSYLKGLSLSDQNRAIVNVALGLVGSPPQPAPVAQNGNTTVYSGPTFVDPVSGKTSVGTEPGNRGVYTTKPGDTLQSVIGWTYGQDKPYGPAAAALRAANPVNLQGNQDGTVIPTNTTIWLPWNPYKPTILAGT